MSKPFQKLVCVDKTNLEQWAIQRLSDFSKSEIQIYEDYPQTETELLERIGDADGLFVSWKTKVSAEVIQKSKNLKYIGMCCSLIDKKSANVDVLAAESLGITVRGVRDYGDEGVVEFVFSQLIALAKGLGKWQWKSQQTELKGKQLGIIGFGTLGKMVAQVALAFGMKVNYYSRTRKPEFESADLKYLPLPELLSKVDVITTHLPRNTKILGHAEFDKIKPNSVLINTSIGPTYDMEAFKEWMTEGDHYTILDADGAAGFIDDYKQLDRVILSDKVSGMTDQAYFRLSQKVIQNVEDYLN
ncbi:NAD(P)-dependent oxidoreductase [Flexithrix dorotheae]|uniref:NAD(P)-dependent oxidoreductase n=1 Tax=Flexithrix dorotheae TaxID=70993 RepID=UPI0003795ED9|nr:NAD(P)-dependent oxidoreductase [Flexithrix dorotheae]